MLVDAILPAELRAVPATAAALEASGHAGAWSFEAAHDPFLPLALAAEHTSRIDLGTAIAVAFARNPMTLAQVAWDLQALSGGRLIVGLGTQIKPHITKRFSMPWSEPAARMREFVEAVRAIWDCWRFGTPLRFRGRFYTHTLMTPFFAPPASDLDGIGPPPIVLAAVGPHMTTVAGEVGDGMLCHPLSTERYLREDTLPALRAARAEAGSTMDGFTIAGQLFVVTGATDEARDAAAASVRRQIAFYASTPAYRPVLERHGWGDLQTDLNRLSKAGDWAAMGELVDDELLNTFAVVAAPDAVAPELLRRFGDVMTRATLYTPYAIDPDVLATVTAALSAGGAEGS